MEKHEILSRVYGLDTGNHTYDKLQKIMGDMIDYILEVHTIHVTHLSECFVREIQEFRRLIGINWGTIFSPNDNGGFYATYSDIRAMTHTQITYLEVFIKCKGTSDPYIRTLIKNENLDRTIEFFESKGLGG
jgi:hypothetical protein